jgi:general L-amino acid transport system permease protein
MAGPSPRRIEPFWRDLRFLQVAGQIAFILVALGAAAWLLSNLNQALEARGLDLSFTFLRRTAGFAITEGPGMARTDPYWRAYVVGLVNTLNVVLAGLVLTTIVGLLAGIALLSPNWLLRNAVRVYVEFIRNTPLLVQLFFIYFGVVLAMPSLEDRIELGPVLLSQRGVWLPRPVPQDGFTIWLAAILAGAALAGAIFVRRDRRRRRTGEVTRPALWAALPLIGLPLIVWLLLPSPPLRFETAVLDGLRMVGGLRLTPEYFALLLGLVLYTGAFIADIVRSGILAVPHGQREAARSLGLSEGSVLRLVILPQAMRVILPPLINQYLNLAKNSSLAIGVAYLDLYAVSQTIFNQSGQTVQVIALLMATYLGLSLLISLLMNWVNRRMRIPGR